MILSPPLLSVLPLLPSGRLRRDVTRTLLILKRWACSKPHFMVSTKSVCGVASSASGQRRFGDFRSTAQSFTQSLDGLLSHLSGDSKSGSLYKFRRRLGGQGALG